MTWGFHVGMTAPISLIPAMLFALSWILWFHNGSLQRYVSHHTSYECEILGENGDIPVLFMKFYKTFVFEKSLSHLWCQKSPRNLHNSLKMRNTRAIQKVRFHIFCLFFRQHWNKLPREECSGDFYGHTVKIWSLYECFSSCFSLVKVELPVAGAAKFEMCVVIRFLHAEGQSAIWNFIELVTENSKWDIPSPLARYTLFANNDKKKNERTKSVWNAICVYFFAKCVRQSRRFFDKFKELFSSYFPFLHTFAKLGSMTNSV